MRMDSAALSLCATCDAGVSTSGGDACRRRFSGSLLLWMALSPGFMKRRVSEKQANRSRIGAFLVKLWRDISFGAFRWQPNISAIGLALLPLFMIGAAVSRVDFKRENQSTVAQATPYHLLLLTIAVLPIVISAFLFRTLATRYILYVSPFVYAFIALGIIASRRFHRVWALAAAALTLAVSVLGLAYYFGTYQKSDYREMSHYLSERYAAGEDVPSSKRRASIYWRSTISAKIEPVPNILADYGLYRAAGPKKSTTKSCTIWTPIRRCGPRSAPSPRSMAASSSPST